MALQALLFSKNPETVESLTAILGEAGIRTEVCADIFSAIDKGTKQSFTCIIADWADQPESGFFVKRAKESAANRNSVVMAIVDDEYASKQAREKQIEFLFHRPIIADEARTELAKARQQMKRPSGAASGNLHTALTESDAGSPSGDGEDPNLLTMAADLPESSHHEYDSSAGAEERIVGEDSSIDEGSVVQPAARSGSFWARFRVAFAVALLGTLAFCCWRGRASFLYVARTPEGGAHVLRQSLAALFYANPSGAQPVASAGTEAQQDAYFSRSSNNSASSPTEVQVVSGEITIPEIPHSLPKAFDFPMPSPELVIVAGPQPTHTYAKVPESLKNSAPIGPPIVVTVNPAQLMPVSTPPPPATLQSDEPVQLSEEAARALVLHAVDAVYPREAMAQKLHGPVVLQAVIGRDGTVQDVKIVRGYFLLGRAAVAAVKQWRFRPYNINGQAVLIRTQITLSFSYPPA